MKKAVKKNKSQKDLNELQDAVLFLGIALIIFFSLAVFNYLPKTQKNLPLNDQPIKQSASLKINPLERASNPAEARSISEILKEQQKYLGKQVYLEGYLVDKYSCEKSEKNNKCNQNIEDFFVVSDFNKKISDYLVKTADDANRVIVRAKSSRIPIDLFNLLGLGEKFIIEGEFIDNLVPIGQTPEGKSVDGLMLVYDKVAVAK